MHLLQYILLGFGMYLSLYVTYTLVLILIHFFVKEQSHIMPEPKTRFAVIMPAHNEELLLERLLDSVTRQDYPSNMIKLIVVADNCCDETAAIGRANGAFVLERCNLQLRGKGYAIKYALENINLDEHNAIFIVDADSIVEESTFRQLDLAITDGARIIQCYNGIANPDDSWFTRLMDVSRTIGNEILEPAKEKINLSSHLMGNGMCFVNDVVSRYGWDAFSVGEDWEYYARTVLQGERIAFVNKARVYHRESVDLKQATSQRLRWSSGRFAIAVKYGSRLFLNGLTSRSLLKIDAALPLVFPNPSLGISLTLLFLMFGLFYPFPAHKGFFLSWFAVLGILQAAVFLIGILYTNNKKKKLMALFLAPIFLIWKSGLDLLSIAGIGRKFWVRTERKL